LQAAQLVQQEYDSRRLQLKQQQQQKEMELKEAKRARQETERIRIVDLQNMKRFQEVQKQHRQDEELQMQQLLISFVTNAKEHEEILRRLREEDSMRNEEKKRSIIEARNEAERNKILQEKTSKQSKWKRDIAMTEHRVRRGQFQWHHGVFGFYDQVRSEEKVPSYVYYSDRQAYFDPLTQQFQVREPSDANVVTYEDEARQQYDTIHGEGAYDAYFADLAFKISVNEQGGYFDDNGEWQVAYGYYDVEQDYAWVPYEGYYDESTGKFIKYAKVQGDLAFMV
jgi:hypothetical protein